VTMLKLVCLERNFIDGKRGEEDEKKRETSV
jgi:hypothetical protein